MKISLNWIKKFTDIVLSPEKLKERVSVSLTEVESIEDFGEKYEEFITVKVTDVTNHPNSKNLLCVSLTDGTKNYRSVVQNCTVSKGDIVVFIKPGLIVPSNGMKVEKIEVKGVVSDGFVPSGRELGLSYDHTTVFTLEAGTKVGVKLNKVLDIDDEILEIKNKMLTHRPDTFGLYGIARELSAIQGTSLKSLDWLESPDKSIAKIDTDTLPLKIIDESDGLCKRYMAIVLSDVTVKPSPVWLQVELSKLGIHPVNNIVDVTNYMMVLTGQPSHAFDYDVVKNLDGDKSLSITVRLAKKDEKIETLDGDIRKLDKDVLVISNESMPIGVAGVMGGKDTEITEKTKNIVYQVENLDMYSIRRTSMKLGIFSDAVTRFSKGIDPNLCEPVIYKAIEMMKDLSGAKVASEIIDIYPSPVLERKITIKGDSIRTKTGIEISDSEISKILKNLDLSNRVNKGKFEIKIPTFRPDLNIEEDINEEVARIFGYDKVIPRLPVRESEPVIDDVYRRNIGLVKRSLYSLGAHEMYTYSFVSASLYKKCNLSMEGLYKLVNAISPELVYMRSFILPSLLDKVSQNVKNFGNYASFEIDKIDPKKKNAKLPEEPWHLGFIHTISFYYSKKYLEQLLHDLGVYNYEIIPLTSKPSLDVPAWICDLRSVFNELRSALILVDGRIIGIVGEIDSQTKTNLSLTDRVSGFELNLDLLEPFVTDVPKYTSISRYPEIVRDYTFVTTLDLEYRKLLESVANVENKIIKNIECLDIFVKDDEKRTTFRITFRHDEKTLTDQEIRELESVIFENVKKKVSGRLVK